MPLLRITCQRGALSAPQKSRMAEALTAALLLAEVGADTAQGRSLAYVLFDEVDAATAWFVGGQPDTSPPPGGRFLFDVVFPVGAAAQHDRTALHAAINRVVAETVGVDEAFPGRVADWVFVHDVPEGHWGAGGQTVGVREINAAAGGGAERAAFHEPLLAAQQRLLAGHGFPPGTGRL